MLVRLTGAHNAESAQTRLSGIVIDGRIALDAGSLTRSLSREELQNLRHVFLSHRHYDHIRDLPALAYATPQAGTLHVYGLPDTLNGLTAHLLNNVIYSAYQERTGEDGSPRVQLHPIEATRSITVGDLSVIPFPADHTAPAVGFLVASGEQRLYYTGDTAPGFSAHLVASPPNIIISEVTYADAGQADADRNGHMTPTLLRGEVEVLTATSGWAPRVVIVHRNPAHDQQIAKEIAALREKTGWDLMLGAADMIFTV